VRSGAGEDGSERVTIIWPDGIVRDQWVEVTVLATEATCLPESQVFYVGNLRGELTGDRLVNDDDLSVLLANWSLGTSIAAGDLTIDGAVNDDDLSVLLANWGGSLGALSPAGGGASSASAPLLAALQEPEGASADRGARLAATATGPVAFDAGQFPRALPPLAVEARTGDDGLRSSSLRPIARPFGMSGAGDGTASRLDLDDSPVDLLAGRPLSPRGVR
jgi:hypothetical protein